MEIGRTEGLSGAGGVERKRVDQPGKTSGTPPTRRNDDSVEISEHARFLSRVLGMAPERKDRIDQIRREIDEGKYETPEKLSGAIDKLFAEEDMGGSGVA